MIFVFLGSWFGIFALLMGGLLLSTAGAGGVFGIPLAFSAVFAGMLTSHYALSERLKRMEDKLDALADSQKDTPEPTAEQSADDGAGAATR